MFDFIRNHQMNIMLCLCAVCATMTVMLFLTKFLSKKRKWTLIWLEIIATLLLFFDRLAYIYAGNPASIGYIMVRLSNFMVFFLTCAIVLCFNLYLIDLLNNEGSLSFIPRRLIITGFISAVGMLVVIISAFTGFYYYVDSENIYHRGPGFLLCYVVPVVCPLIQYTAIVQYRKCFSKFIYTALTLYIFLPIATGIIQIIAYGISIVNMAMVLVSVFLYFFTYLDVNDAVEKAHRIEIQSLKTEQKNVENIFYQLALAFAKTQNISIHSAQVARRIAQKAGKSEEDCDKIYYATFLCEAGPEALSCIKDYPYLYQTALYVGKDYDASLPEYSRIITVAKDYDKMINDPTVPPFFVRDYFLREAGHKYDPAFANIVVRILDEGTNSGFFEKAVKNLESEIVCHDYRENISMGIEISRNYTDISFDCLSLEDKKAFSAPSIIVFDSYDKQVQTSPETINSNKYLEYGEIWFDQHYISTGARNIEIRNQAELSESGSNSYKITACRYEDHLLIKMQSPEKCFDTILALPSASKSAYIGITGENIKITNIKTQLSEKKAGENDIPRIAEKINYIDRMESDIPNLQISKPLEAFTKGIEIKDKMNIYFHTQSLPDANLIWHCPYILLYYSDDQLVHGKNYREYAMVKFDGESNEEYDFAKNDFVIKKTDSFKSWEEWEKQNKAGYESQIEFFKSGNQITLRTQNKGIYIQNTTILKDGNKEVYLALSGDQVALTDIRIR